MGIFKGFVRGFFDVLEGPEKAWRQRAQKAETAAAKFLEARNEAAQQVDGLQERIRLLEGQIAAFESERKRLRDLEVSAPVVNAMRAWWATKREKDWGDVADACRKAWGASSKPSPRRSRKS